MQFTPTVAVLDEIDQEADIVVIIMLVYPA